MPVYYHGGVPGKKPGDLIRSATDLGFTHYRDWYAKPPVIDDPNWTSPYDPDLVSVTTHLGSARGYAARYLNQERKREPGDVYEVEVSGSVTADPDFHDPQVYVRTDKPAVITCVIERAVVLTRREQNRECWPYRYYADWQPVHAEDGTVQVSPQMRSEGVRDEYAVLLPKWMDTDEFGSGGTILAPTLPRRPASAEYVLHVFDHLEIDTGPHTIERFNHPLTGRPILRCRHCGEKFGSTTGIDTQDWFRAVDHQAGPELRLIKNYNCGGTLRPFVEVLGNRAPHRWEWALHD
ncbi:Uncharacterised protein [Mycobacteroides abscessus]|uniref:hypothetical protein n=1 Tax=Mycobacteroides abscessus TaxID=36809 RepID=UPI0005DDEE8A|nr:hypothetical protein [Mycobacteroides abscessus]PVB15161.1 hypothetical protein DDJ68_09240 [Mycobacteroides abscessus]RIR97158.1 hypothetical protein D2E57_07430 [Mycobacteroides abscessus]CPW79322.1 Uncharacterised protein [Mycobacteroides abscessus]CRG57376.1 Uncharacterised protein [Mycobacteroides abscessus]SLA06875.1 Uncharacterised protein [Mycobacteroides abscessus subsp. abscessus]